MTRQAGGGGAGGEPIGDDAGRRPAARAETGPAGAGEPSDAVVTIPNALSVARLIGVPVYLWLILGPHADAAALGILAASGASDYLDGKIARWLRQTSRLGVLLDPAADRLYVFATVLSFVIRDIIPWWLAAILFAREAVLALCLPILRRHGYGPPPVHYLGKAATFCLMYAFPLLLLAGILGGTGEEVTRPIGWAFAIWGSALYVWSGALYVWQVAGLVRAAGGYAASTKEGAGEHS